MEQRAVLIQCSIQLHPPLGGGAMEQWSSGCEKETCKNLQVRRLGERANFYKQIGA
jgi:hypothetical protein